MRIEEVSAIITGAAGGLGRYFVLQLAKAGARVAACDVDGEGLKRLERDVVQWEESVLIRQVNITQESSVVGFVQDVAGHFGGINTLVNNAGVLRDGLLASPLSGWIKKMPTAQWQHVIDVNLTGSFLVAREVVASILERDIKPAVIANISSVTSAGNPGQSNYSASKAGLDALTFTWARELACYGIRVGAIAPGLIDTPILSELSEQALGHLVQAVPLCRTGTPHEVWLALKFMIECEYFTGRSIQVDGGANF